MERGRDRDGNDKANILRHQHHIWEFHFKCEWKIFEPNFLL